MKNALLAVLVLFAAACPQLVPPIAQVATVAPVAAAAVAPPVATPTPPAAPAFVVGGYVVDCWNEAGAVVNDLVRDARFQAPNLELTYDGGRKGTIYLSPAIACRALEATTSELESTMKQKQALAEAQKKAAEEAQKKATEEAQKKATEEASKKKK